MDTKKIFVLIGPSGSGKTTIGNYLKSELGFKEIISHTTRKPRTGEKEGYTYYFVSPEEFMEIEKIEFVEYAGNYYGLSVQEVENKLNNYDKIFVITELEGLKKLKEIYKEKIKSILITAPPNILVKRMIERGDSQTSIYKRSIRLIDELKNYKGKTDYEVENIDYIQTIEKIKEILIKEGVVTNDNDK